MKKTIFISFLKRNFYAMACWFFSILFYKKAIAAGEWIGEKLPLPQVTVNGFSCPISTIVVAIPLIFAIGYLTVFLQKKVTDHYDAECRRLAEEKKRMRRLKDRHEGEEG